MEIVQQYPTAQEDEGGAKSLRLNHPSWADVHGTKYAIGTIVDFEKISDDPIGVTSR
jgi:hypothetical protein